MKKGRADEVDVDFTPGVENNPLWLFEFRILFAVSIAAVEVVVDADDDSDDDFLFSSLSGFKSSKLNNPGLAIVEDACS